MAIKKFSEEERADIVEAYRGSGMRQREFCEHRGISVSGLQSCLKRAEAVRGKAAGFIELSKPALVARPSLEISYVDGTVVKVV